MIQLIDWVPKQQILLSEQSEKPKNIRCYQDIRNFSAAETLQWARFIKKFIWHCRAYC